MPNRNHIILNKHIISNMKIHQFVPNDLIDVYNE